MSRDLVPWEYWRAVAMHLARRQGEIEDWRLRKDGLCVVCGADLQIGILQDDRTHGLMHLREVPGDEESVMALSSILMLNEADDGYALARAYFGEKPKEDL